MADVEYSVSLDTSRVQRGAAQAVTSFKDLRQQALNTSGAFDAASRRAGALGGAFDSLRNAAAGLAAGLSFGAIMREFAAFDKGLIAIGKTADMTGAELQGLGSDIQKIARTVPVATSQLLDIAGAAGQLGVKGSDNIKKFTEVVGKLGLASNLAGDEAATTLARMLTVTGEAISDVDRLGSTIVQLGNNFAATEKEIAASAQRVAQSTSIYDVSAASAAGLGAALRSVGVEAELGGGAVGRAFGAINAAVRGGAEEMAVLQKITGKTADDLRQRFATDSVSVFRDVVTGLGALQDKGGDVAAALSDMGLKGTENIQVMGALSSNAGVLVRALEMASDEWRANTALNKKAATAAESFSAKMQTAKNTLSEAAVVLGEGFAPAIVKASTSFNEMVQRLKDGGALADAAQLVGGALKFAADNFEYLVAIGVGVAFQRTVTMMVSAGRAAFEMAKNFSLASAVTPAVEIDQPTDDEIRLFLLGDTQ